MSQYDFGTIDPAAKSGAALAGDLNAWRSSVHSNHSGIGAPTYAVAGMTWVKTVTAAQHEIYYFDGSDHILLGTVNPTLNSYSPSLVEDLSFSGVGNRITGDFSNATVANRVMFQTSTVNGNSGVAVIPNGTGTIAQYQAYSRSDATNASRADFAALDGTDVRLASSITGTGTYLPMTFYTGGVERMRIDTSGQVGIGFAPNTSQGSLQLWKNASGGAPTSSGSTDTNQIASFGLGSIGLTFGAYASGAYWIQNRSLINFALNYDIAFQPNGGNTLHVGPNGGLGYGTGAGGSVTQSTNKGTAVTLNKPCGQITMNNASLAAGALVTFAVNNSLVAQYDVPVIALGNVGTGATYEAWVSYVATGVFYITLKNNSGGALGEAVKINFSLLKGAVA